MSRLLISALFGLAIAASAQQNPTSPPPAIPPVQTATCSNEPKSNLPPCEITKKQHKAALEAYKRGLKLQQKGRLDEAFEDYKLAAKLDPTDAEFVSGREVARQQIVHDALERGNKALANNQSVIAMAEFRRALELDPDNDFVRQRVRDVLGEVRLPSIQVMKEAPGEGPISIMPDAGVHDFHVRGTTRDLLEQIARAYGMTAIMDDTIVSRPVRFDVQAVDFTTAMSAALRVTKAFYVPLSARQLLFVADSQQNRQAYERMSTRTFYVPDASTPQELNEIVNVLRIMFDVRFVAQQASNNTLVVRAPAQTVDAITQFLEGLGGGRPQVVFDIKAYEISQSLAKQVGVDIPSTLGVYNVPTEVQKLLGNQSVNDIINQLIASGAINQGNTTAIAALVAQFLGQSSSPLLNTTLILFGGGLTLNAIPIPPLTVHLNMDQSDVRNLEDVTLRAGHGTPAILKIGQRVPIINATYAPIYNSSAISKILGNQTYRAPFPSVQYEDLGVNVKATPTIRRGFDVAVDLEMQIRSLSAVVVNGVPVISNREYKGAISVKDGESIVVAGMLTETEQRTLKGIPGLNKVPVLNAVTSVYSPTNQTTELLIVMTPHIIRTPESNASNEIPMPPAAGR
jgi:general secretion pathway protein D